MTTHALSVKRLVMGIGNDFRGDDAAGLAAIRRLNESRPDSTVTMEITGDAAGILDSWKEFDEVVIIDACSSGSVPGTLFRFEAGSGPLPEGILRGCSTHTMGIANVIELARVLGRMPARLTVFAIEGADFSIGATISRVVSGAVEELVSQLRREWIPTITVQS